ncbi:glycine C-acetyltransferase [Chromobacterium subtsugae]|uniref:2-amino-3-ketobutyrate coenzyme A ligase n=1 Tax=Chromobacterium subtsugae TaxID=251747 RepID=A0ABS7FCY9_9NEIS|nr:MULTISPECIES: glycine C-acetyltransferase [Chromobacterium]KUM03898.1 2-amino-3-ketobutyrate CoA ligase [Chromobacterium subtsugae]KZE84497.1 glycine C-acetyltransferase [Chromobacterium sp. F49]MBW7566184.1 glycine C-acetyltransferase [Chromobacterium subtsugae]MBW8287305.1 glycine C-acetyltransferase [Chromobacterium subtsugae]OBU87457.1 2-amino-3-ketobutyrate CoA ligase [Chromobacterium subtsugae]
MNHTYLAHLQATLAQIRADGFEKPERVIATPQSAGIALAGGEKVLNFCANNYLGLADDKRLVLAAKAGMDEYGYGCASVRFICGTQSIHKQLEKSISEFLGTDDTILYSSCFDANGGVFETLLSEEDAVISDELNHASIIDGVRLSKAKRFRYKNNDMADLEAQLIAAEAAGARFKLIVTDGVFSMDGIIANLKGLCEVADRHGAIVMVDDSHAVGFIGESGAGTPELCGVADRVDIYTGTLGKALGGASGGYVAARQPIVDLLRQRSRPYLFSNTLAPAIAAASVEVLSILKSGEGAELRAKVRRNAELFRKEMAAAGFTLVPGEHPIVPVMLGDARLAGEMAARLLKEGVYVIGFSYPVVPKGKARIRTQMSAAHSEEQVLRAVAAFIKVGRELGVIPD